MKCRAVVGGNRRLSAVGIVPVRGITAIMSTAAFVAVQGTTNARFTKTSHRPRKVLYSS